MRYNTIFWLTFWATLYMAFKKQATTELSINCVKSY